MGILDRAKKPWRQDDKRERWREWCDRILSDGVNLTAWEGDFAESIDSQLSLGRSLSERQAEILERIYSERVPSS